MGADFWLELGPLDREGNWVPKSKEKSIEVLWKKPHKFLAKCVPLHQEILTLRKESGLMGKDSGLYIYKKPWNLECLR